VKLCLISDLHFEINDYSLKGKVFSPGDVLIVAGDLTCARFFHPQRTDKDALKHRKWLTKFVDEISSKFKHCLYVLGNHEHYGSVFSETVDTLRTALRDTNVAILDNDTITIDAVRFFGATMWTSFNGGSPHEMLIVEQFMNDYNYIFRKRPDELTYVERNSALRSVRNATITPDSILVAHDNSVKALTFFLQESQKDKKNVVITHHAPSLRAQNVARYGTQMIHAYCTNLEYLMHEYDIDLWVYGHTHDSMDFTVNRTRVLSNQMGYVGHDPRARDFRPVYVDV